MVSKIKTSVEEFQKNKFCLSTEFLIMKLSSLGAQAPEHEGCDQTASG
jgi:hypothetical protein